MNDNRAGALPPHRAESRLIKAASDAVRNHCANPGRTDCPDSEAIHAVVVRRVAYPGFDDTVDHIAMCAPCLDEYNGRRRDYRVRRRRRWAVAFAAVLLLGFFCTYIVTRRSSPNDQAAQKPAQPPLLAFTVDYSGWTAERSASPAQHRFEPPRLPRGRLALTLILPIGTDDGAYSVEVRSASGEIVAHSKGVAAWTAGAERLNTNVDLSPVSAGAYTITVQSADTSQRTYPVLLE